MVATIPMDKFREAKLKNDELKKKIEQERREHNQKVLRSYKIK